MAIIPSALSPVSNTIDSILPDRYLVSLQEMLIRSGNYVKASDLLTLIIGLGLLMGIAFFIFFTVLGLNPILGLLLGLFAPGVIILVWTFFMMERRVDAIEKDTPDFLRQISSLLRA
jgi:archaeal flagellar protein FlaJ